MDTLEMVLLAYAIIGVVYSVYVFGMSMIWAILHVAAWPIFAALTSMGILKINSDCDYREE